MMIDTTFSLYALLISNACLLAAAALAVLRFQRMLQESTAFWKSPTGAAIQSESTEPGEHGRLLLREVAVLQKTVARLCERQPPCVETQPGLPIENALRMAKQGASIEDLTKSCGLNVGEAQLVQKLHGRPAASASVAEEHSRIQ